MRIAARLAWLSGLASIATPAHAQGDGVHIWSGDLTATVAVTSDYVYRGLSLTRSDPAVQAGLDYALENGAYLGAWGSNVDFTDGDDVEIDLYAGYSGGEEAIFYDIAVWYFGFPGSPGTADRWEVIGSAGIDYGFAMLTAGIGYSPDFFDAGNSLYGFGEARVPLRSPGPVKATVVGRLGYQSIDNAVRFGVNDYLEWILGVTFEFKGFELDLNYHDTDIAPTSPRDANARLKASLRRVF
ncbi:MAG: TorF family putative porin [Sphingomonadales bacterium]